MKIFLYLFNDATPKRFEFLIYTVFYIVAIKLTNIFDFAILISIIWQRFLNVDKILINGYKKEIKSSSSPTLIIL